MRWAREGEGGSGRVTPGGGGVRAPRSHFYDELFYRACRRFSFSIFYVLFPLDHKLCLKEGNSRTFASTGIGVKSSEFSVFPFLFFYGLSCVGAAASPWRLHHIRPRGAHARHCYK